MTLNKINWKLFFEKPQAVRPDDFFKVFNTWIPASPEVFVDVADYQHVKDGPLTLLSGYYVDYVLDHTDRKLGFLYNQKVPRAGETLKQTLKDFLKTCDRLVKDPLFAGKLQLSSSELQLTINDRALAPNHPKTFETLKPQLTELCDGFFGKGSFELEHEANPKKRFTVLIKNKSQKNIQQLLGA